MQLICFIHMFSGANLFQIAPSAPQGPMIPIQTNVPISKITQTICNFIYTEAQDEPIEVILKGNAIFCSKYQQDILNFYKTKFNSNKNITVTIEEG